MQLTQSLHRAVQQTPDQIATIYRDRQRTIVEQRDRVARIAGALHSHGVAAGDRVGILSLNSDRYLELLYAVPWAGAVLNPANTRWSAAEISYSFVESGTNVVFVDDQFAAIVPALQEAQPDLQTVVFMGDGDLPDGMVDYEQMLAAATPAADAERRDDDLAGLFYTGGTTGFPKGVMLSHRNLLTSAMGTQATYPFVVPGGRLLHAAPMFHLADLAAWNAQVMVGGTHVVVPGFDPVAVLTAIQEHGVTNALLVPTMIQMLADHSAVADYDLSSLRVVLYGASPITAAVLERAAKAFPSAEFVQAYGMTELAPIATLLTPDAHQDPEKARSAGRATAHSSVMIVDESGLEVPRGEVGEVVVRGDHVMLGYWNKPDETAEALRDGWMHTGDGGRMDADGYVYIVDRIKDMIISGGENVYSTEVENALAKHPDVAACAVIGVPDPEWGERVHAVIVPRGEATFTLEDLRAHVKDLIAGYKAPRSFEVVDALPVSGAGKVLKRELRAKHWDRNDRGVN